METEKWRRLYGYWQSKHVGDRPPSRSEIDPPLEIPELVPNLMIVDKAPEGYRFRLVGSDIASRLGFDMTGTLLGSNGTDPSAVEQFRAASDFVITQQRPRLLVARVSGRKVAKSLVIMVPLVQPSGETDKLLCGWFFNREFEPGTRLQDLSVIEIDL